MLNINFSPFPVLTTERLVLRRIDENDLNELLFLRSDKEVIQYLDRDPVQSVEETNAFIRSLDTLLITNEAVTWGITLKENPKLIGTICIWHIQRQHHRAEVGYALYPDQWGKGIMNEALSCVLDYGFDVMKLHSMEAIVNPNNGSSIRLLKKNKFVEEGYFRENYFYKDKYLDSAVYSLLSSERK